MPIRVSAGANGALAFAQTPPAGGLSPRLMRRPPWGAERGPVLSGPERASPRRPMASSRLLGLRQTVSAQGLRSRIGFRLSLFGVRSARCVQIPSAALAAVVSSWVISRARRVPFEPGLWKSGKGIISEARSLDRGNILSISSVDDARSGPDGRAPPRPKVADLADVLDPTGDSCSACSARGLGPGEAFRRPGCPAPARACRATPRARYGTRFCGAAFSRSTPASFKVPAAFPLQARPVSASASALRRNVSTSISAHTARNPGIVGGQSNQHGPSPSPSSGSNREQLLRFLPTCNSGAPRFAVLMQTAGPRKRHACPRGGHPRRPRQRWPQESSALAALPEARARSCNAPFCR